MKPIPIDNSPHNVELLQRQSTMSESSKTGGMSNLLKVKASKVISKNCKRPA